MRGSGTIVLNKTTGGIIFDGIYDGHLGATIHARHMGPKRRFVQEAGSILDDPEETDDTDDPDFKKPRRRRIRRQVKYPTQ